MTMNKALYGDDGTEAGLEPDLKEFEFYGHPGVHHAKMCLANMGNCDGLTCLSADSSEAR